MRSQQPSFSPLLAPRRELSLMAQASATSAPAVHGAATACWLLMLFTAAAATPCITFCETKFATNITEGYECKAGCVAASRALFNTKSCLCTTPACEWGCNYEILCSFCSSSPCVEEEGSHASFRCSQSASSGGANPAVLIEYSECM
jgi:hypothetical protein